MPVVFVNVFDPVELGLVPSLGRPGGNITGLAVEQTATFELVINRRTAKTLSLTIPRTLLIQANHLIE